MAATTHWVRPCKHHTPRGRHLLIYISEIEERGVIKPKERRLWRFDMHRGSLLSRLVDDYHTTNRLDSLLDQSVSDRGTTTIWLLRGWTDLVLSGLAELMDAGLIQWRYASIQGQQCLIRGTWRGRSIIITSLSNWTGGKWDSWDDVDRDEAVQQTLSQMGTPAEIAANMTGSEEIAAVNMLALLCQSSVVFGLHQLYPTSSAAGMAVWRSWLSPIVATVDYIGPKAKKGTAVANTKYCIPIPTRPLSARRAERHVCYSLVNRHLRRGRVDGPIYCIDLRSAYMVGMLTTPLPAMYYQSLRKPHVDELIDALCDRTGLALVRINGNDCPFPTRINGQSVLCRGRYWTWICGSELVTALCLGHVSEVWAAHIWNASYIKASVVESIHCLSMTLNSGKYPGIKAAWRACYSSVVGRFAGWHSVWVDTHSANAFGRWATWDQADPDTGEIVPYRSIAGHVQMMRERVDRDDAVPLMYGCITSQVRRLVTSMVDAAGVANCVCIASDSIWVTKTGRDTLLSRLDEVGVGRDGVKIKEVYDRIWCNGRSVAIVEMRGKKILRMPGVGKCNLVDTDGKVMVDHVDDWTGIETPSARQGVRKRAVRYNAAKLLSQLDYDATVVPYGETVDIPLLDQAMLQPIRGRRTIDEC